MSRKSRVDIKKPVGGERWRIAGQNMTIVGKYHWKGTWIVINENDKLEIQHFANFEEKLD